jgi:hypothetical protein
MLAYSTILCNYFIAKKFRRQVLILSQKGSAWRKTQSHIDLSNAFWYFTGARILIIMAGKRS